MEHFQINMLLLPQGYLFTSSFVSVRFIFLDDLPMAIVSNLSSSILNSKRWDTLRAGKNGEMVIENGNGICFILKQ